jgi:hypothetical protein
MGYDDYGTYSKVHGMPHRAKIKRWEVIDKDGIVYLVEGHYAFNNGNDGLVFRRRLKLTDEHTSVVAAWGNGFWAFYKEINDVE